MRKEHKNLKGRGAENPKHSSQDNFTVKTIHNVQTLNNPAGCTLATMDRSRSRRSAALTRSLSRRLVRTLSEMIDASDDGDDSLCFLDSMTPSFHSRSIHSRSSSDRSLALSRSLSKKLVHTISEIFVDEENGEDDEGMPGLEDYRGLERDLSEQSLKLTRSLSKTLVRTISELFDDDENSLDIFGSSTSSIRFPSEHHKPKWRSTQELDVEPMDEMLNDSGSETDSFHNSLNDWMGSFSDILEKNKEKKGALTAKDRAALKTDVKRLTELSEYLSKSLPSPHLPTLKETASPHCGARKKLSNVPNNKFIPLDSSLRSARSLRRSRTKPGRWRDDSESSYNTDSDRLDLPASSSEDCSFRLRTHRDDLPTKAYSFNSPVKTTGSQSKSAPTGKDDSPTARHQEMFGMDSTSISSLPVTDADDPRSPTSDTETMTRTRELELEELTKFTSPLKAPRTMGGRLGSSTCEMRRKQREMQALPKTF